LFLVGFLPALYLLDRPRVEFLGRSEVNNSLPTRPSDEALAQLRARVARLEARAAQLVAARQQKAGARTDATPGTPLDKASPKLARPSRNPHRPRPQEARPALRPANVATGLNSNGARAGPPWHVLRSALRHAAAAPAESLKGCYHFVTEWPLSSELQSALAQALHHDADELADRSELQAARTLYTEAVRRQQRALEALPGHPAYRRRLRDHCFRLACIRLELGDHSGAAGAARQMAAVFPGSWQDAFQAARLLARCVASAEQDDRILLRESRQIVERYGAEAVALLDRALAGAPKGLPPLHEVPDLEAIRARPDFARLAPSPPRSGRP
jgi:hypothetical protein